MSPSVDISAFDAEIIADLRETFSLGLHQVRKILELLADGTCPNLLCAVYSEHASGFAINVKGGAEARLRWNLEIGTSYSESALLRDPSLSRFSSITASKAFPTAS